MGKILGIVDGSERITREYKLNGYIYYLAKSITREYNVIATDLEETSPGIIENTPGMPQIGDEEGTCFCRRHELIDKGTVRKQDGFPTRLWGIIPYFDNEFEPPTGSAEDDQEDPTETRASRRWSGYFEDYLLKKDVVTGNPIQTTAKEPIIYESKRVIDTLEITRLELAPFPPLTKYSYENRLNITEFYGAPKGTVLMGIIETEETVINGMIFERVSYKMHFNLKEDPLNPLQFLEDTWQLELRNRGTQYVKDFVADPDGIVKATDEEGNLISVDLYLDGTKNVSDDPIYLDFSEFRYAEFNNLILGP